MLGHTRCGSARRDGEALRRTDTFQGTGCGLVFEEDEDTAYLYVTDESHGEIYDALWIYEPDSPEELQPGDPLTFVWNGELMKAGVITHGSLLAAIDFRNRKACCRAGHPPADERWCTSSHDWDEDIAAGLES